MAAAAVLVVATVHARAATLFSETFDASQPGSAYTSTIPGAAFQVTSGNVDIIGNLTNGAGSGFFTCPGPNNGANNCLDLNGNNPGAITTTTGFNLTAGTTYTLSFNLAGSVVPNVNYVMQATIGGSTPFTFSVPGGNDFGTETVSFTPTANEANAHLSFASLTDLPGNSEYGPLIDNVVLTSAPAGPNPGGTLLFQQDLTTAAPGPNYRGPLSNSGLTVTAGDVDIFGNGTGSGTAGFYTCPAPLTANQTCIDLNGDQPGTIQTDQVFNLIAGTTYTVSFELAGNIPNGNLSEYTLGASFGNSGIYTFSAPPGAPFQTESFSYTPTTDESQARLVLSSQQYADLLNYGPIITDLSISDPPGSGDTVSASEPGVLSVILTSILSLAWLRRRQTPDRHAVKAVDRGIPLCWTRGTRFDFSPAQPDSVA